MNKPILFIDFDGTICHDRYWRSLPLEQYEIVQKVLFQENKQLVNEWMLGKHTSEDINVWLASQMNMSFEELWDIFVHDCKTMSVAQEVLKKINDLRKEYVVILITGNMDSFSRFTVPALDLEKYFDDISNSYNEGRHKTHQDGKTFVKYIQLYKANPKECFVIDDSQNVCNVFNRLGGKSYLVSKEFPIDFPLSEIAFSNFCLEY